MQASLSLQKVPPATQAGPLPFLLAHRSVGPLQLLLFFHRQVTKSTTNPDELGILANQLTNDYGQLAQEAKPAALTAENEEVRALGGMLECAVEQSRVCWSVL